MRRVPSASERKSSLSSTSRNVGWRPTPSGKVPCHLRRRSSKAYWHDCRSVPLHLQGSSQVFTIFQITQKGGQIHWTEEHELALNQLKSTLSEPPILSHPKEGETLYSYLVVADKVLSTVLVCKTYSGQKLVYFVSMALKWPKLRYQKVEKVALELVIVARPLRPYFKAHPVVVVTN